MSEQPISFNAQNNSGSSSSSHNDLNKSDLKLGVNKALDNESAGRSRSSRMATTTGHAIVVSPIDQTITCTRNDFAKFYTTTNTHSC